MTPNEFRRIALSFPETDESEHMGHPDYRVGGKVFATLGYPDRNYGMVKLSPITQKEFLAEAPKAFRPAKGKWGMQGATIVNLKFVSKRHITSALKEAWYARAPARFKKI